MHVFDFADGYLGHALPVAVAAAGEKFAVSGVALDKTGNTLFVAGPFSDAVRSVSLNPAGKHHAGGRSARDSYPYTCLPAADGKRLFVSLWGKAGIGVVDLAESKSLWLLGPRKIT